jgi:5,10-methylenetetrahydromethanopterin reductase
VMPMVLVTDDPDEARDRVAAKYGAAGELPAYRAMLDRGGLAGPAEALVTGDEETVLRELHRYRDAGATDLIVHPVGSKEERVRTLDVLVAV